MNPSELINNLLLINEVCLLRKLMHLRENTKGEINKLIYKDIITRSKKLHEHIKHLHTKIEENEKAFNNIIKIKSLAENTNELLKHMLTNIPKSISQKFSENPSNIKKNTPKKIIKKNSKIQKKITKITKNTQKIIKIKINHLTKEELSNTPKHIKYRISLDKINFSIDEINNVLEDKYKILNIQNVNKIKNRQMSNRIEILKKEMNKYKDLRFFMDRDLKKSTYLNGSSTGKAILIVLRYNKRIKVLSGSEHRYALLE